MDGSDQFLHALSTSLESFLQPSDALHTGSLLYLKAILDPLATDIASAQKLRRDGNRKKRKRDDLGRDEDVLQLRQVYVKNLAPKQVWEQTRRILDATSAEIERDISTHKERNLASIQKSGLVHRREENNTSELGEELSISDDSSDGEIVTAQDSDVGEDELLEGDDVEDEDDLDDLEDIEEGDSDESTDSEHGDHGDHEIFVQDPNNLNDGFFSIDDFNKQTQFLEQQDARGEDDNPSDEDDIDWDADPLTMSFHTSKRNASNQSDKNEQPSAGDDESSDEEDGPTFGNADLNADDSGEDGEDLEGNDLDNGFNGLDNTNEVRYADFFAPPPKKQSKTKRMRALPKTQPKPQQREQDEDNKNENDLQRAIADVRRDLLESDEEMSDVESRSDAQAVRPSTKNMSTRERQRAAIAAEIRQLEAANVAKRNWTLSGEARAADRPLNSLIEEDLEFERVGKPVPVITAEVSEEIEQLIKRRILAREFDEVIRRRPDATGGANAARRGRIDLDDTKPQSGLAEIYEQEHLKATDPGYVDKRTAATQKQHEEISRRWKEVSNQLDLLSNLHFKPKRTEVEIKAVEDKPTISMEDARPVGVGINAEESMLAPQEVYRPGEEKRGKAAVVRKGGASASKEEMTREEKLRLRRREKERSKKAQANASVSGPGAVVGNSHPSQKSNGRPKEQEKSDILSELRKGNVKVVGKKGDLQDLDGKKAKGRASAGVLAGGSLKL